MKEYTFDLAVIGGGGAGISAALRASELGAKVVLLEKAASIGGSSAMCRGIGAVGSREQNACPECDFTISDLMTEYLRQTNYLADNALIYKFLSNSGKTVDWLQENGAIMEYVGNAQEKHLGSKLKTYFNWGEAKIRELREMMKTVEARGGMTLLRTAAASLIMANGRVAGVMARTRDGETVKINCRAAALCSGGYGNNEEMVLKATGGVKVNMINSGGQTGDGINMAVAAGAATENINSIEFHGVSLPFDKMGARSMHGSPGFLGRVVSLFDVLWVNHSGHRFVNEEISADISFTGNVAFRQGSEFFSIFSAEMADILEKEGTDALGLEPIVEGPVLGNMVCPGLRDELKSAMEKTIAYYAETPEELARAIGVDEKRFMETFNEYNAACRDKLDPMFGKKANHLYPLRGPLYAVELRAAELCSLGGVRIDTDMQVLDNNGRVIPGLYAGGCDASGGLFNNAYVSLEGMTIGWAFTSGRLIGESAAAFLGYEVK